MPSCMFQIAVLTCTEWLFSPKAILSPRGPGGDREGTEEPGEHCTAGHSLWLLSSMTILPASNTRGLAGGSCLFGSVPVTNSWEREWELPIIVYQHHTVKPKMKCVKTCHNLHAPSEWGVQLCRTRSSAQATLLLWYLSAKTQRSFLFLQKMHVFQETSNTGTVPWTLNIFFAGSNFVFQLLIWNKNTFYIGYQHLLKTERHSAFKQIAAVLPLKCALLSSMALTYLKQGRQLSVHKAAFRAQAKLWNPLSEGKGQHTQAPPSKNQILPFLVCDAQAITWNEVGGFILTRAWFQCCPLFPLEDHNGFSIAVWPFNRR